MDARRKKEFDNRVIVTATAITRAAADPDDVQQVDCCRHSLLVATPKRGQEPSKEPIVQPVLQARGRIIPATLQVCLT